MPIHEVGLGEVCDRRDGYAVWYHIKVEREQVTVDTLPIWCAEPRPREPQLSLLFDAQCNGKLRTPSHEIRLFH
jgi:hypothetical protein